MKNSEKEFIAEAEEILEEAGKLLLEIQETYADGADPDSVNALFRSLHTLKGLSGLFGFSAVTEISHSLENLLDDVRLGRIEISEKLIHFIFNYLDVLRHLIENIETEKDADFRPYIEEIDDFRKKIEGKGGGSSLEGLIDPSILRTLSEYEEHRLKANIKEGKGIYLGRTVYSMADFDKQLEETSKKIKGQGELISTLPTSTNLPPESIGFNLLFGSTSTLDELKAALKIEIDELVALSAEKAGSPGAPGGGQAGGGGVGASALKDSSLKTASTTVRVDIEKLDRILNTIGEITLAKSAISRISLELRETLGSDPLTGDMNKISQTLERRLMELQDQVLEIRMVPIGQIFSRLSQVIKRYSADVGKKIDLQMYGEDTELDKYLAEEIIDPLVHIVRNAIDHGIESASDRTASGKREAATVILKAFQRGNHVVILVQDDGQGIDAEKIRRKAIQKGLLVEGQEVQRRDLLDLIFMPGFSTKEQVSEVSGRGVGLDIVRDKLSTLGGFADVETEQGAGTSFILTLPITLAIIKSLIVRLGYAQFAIPLTSISETLVIEHRELQTIEGRDVFNLRGDLLPVTSLNDLFNLPMIGEEGRSFAVVVGFGERRIGLLVDELLGQQEIVIKTLGDDFKGLRGFAGAAEIGRHEVILVIDVEGVIEESQLRQRGVINV